MNVWSFLGLLVGAAGLIGSVLTAALTHHSQGKAVEVDRFEAITKALEGRIKDLEDSLRELKEELKGEREEHHETRELLRIALRHIRAVIVWAAGPQTEPLPLPPHELLDHI